MKIRFVYFLMICCCCANAQTRVIDSISELIRNAPDAEEAAVQKAKLSVKLYSAGNSKKAYKLLDESVQEALSLKSARALGEAYNSRGALFYYEAKFDSALIYFEKSLVYRRQIKDNSGILRTISNMGAIHYMKMNYTQALQFFEEALKLESDLGFKEGTYVSINNIASVYNVLKIPQKALYYYKRAEKIYQETSSGDLAFTYDGLSTYYHQHGKNDSAMIYARKWEDIAGRTGEMSSLAFALTNIGMIYNATGRRDSAVVYYRKALPLTFQLNDKRLRLGVYANIAAAYIETKQMDSAQYYMQYVVPLQEELQNKKYEEDLARLFAEYYFNKKDFEKAYHYLKKFSVISDSVYQVEISEKVAAMQEKFQTERKEKENAVLQAENRGHKTVRNYLLMVVVLSFLCIIGGVFAYRKIRRSNKLISQQKSLVEEKQKEILDSINYARRIQFALLASDQLLSAHLPEYFVLFKPKAVVSGDFYWATALGDELLLLTGDCTGHGVPGAFMSLLNITKVSQVINEKNITRPDHVLNEVRREIISVLNPNGHTEQSSDGMDAVLYKIDLKNKQLEYAAANNTFYIIRNGEVLHCKADKMPVGKGHDDSVLFSYNQLKLEKDDVIYTFSDGYADQFGGPVGKKFKYKQLEELFLKIYNEPMNRQKQLLEEQFEKWRGDLEQVDDVCIIGVRVA
jgi:serine phosphatase RsbU (regulator of sigma subunit)